MASDTKNLYECVVIGGGVAGSAAAYHLAAFGYRVAVLERSIGPHHKVCGEFLSYETLDLLEEIGISLDDDSPAIKHFQLSSPRSEATFTFPFPGRGMSRHTLDEELLKNAASAGADVFRGVCMRSFQQQDKGVIRIETTNGDFYARHLFMATGKHDHSKEHKREGKDNSYVGLKTHIRLKAPSSRTSETTVLFTFPGGYGGICPVERGAMNFCFLIDKKIYKSLNGNFDATLSFLRRSNRQIDLVFREADLIAPVSAIAHIPYGFLRDQSRQENVYFLGDQRMVIPSLTGDGMAIALSTAKDAAYEFHSRQQGLSIDVEQTRKGLERQMHWAFLAQNFLKAPWAMDLCMRIPGLSHFLIETIFQKTRISRTENIYHAREPAVASDPSGR
jgi:flavin-dependent dehydrogenase